MHQTDEKNQYNYSNASWNRQSSKSQSNCQRKRSQSLLKKVEKPTKPILSPSQVMPMPSDKSTKFPKKGAKSFSFPLIFIDSPQLNNSEEQESCEKLIRQCRINFVIPQRTNSPFDPQIEQFKAEPHLETISHTLPQNRNCSCPDSNPSNPPPNESKRYSDHQPQKT